MVQKQTEKKFKKNKQNERRQRERERDVWKRITGKRKKDIYRERAHIAWEKIEEER